MLGEVSICKFYSNQSKGGGEKETKEREESDVFYGVSEMVSHHPPVSAYP